MLEYLKNKNWKISHFIVYNISIILNSLNINITNEKDKLTIPSFGIKISKIINNVHKKKTLLYAIFLSWFLSW